ncbi:MAG: DUF6498-containing protein [archaeon]|jgi:hypothetical protein
MKWNYLVHPSTIILLIVNLFGIYIILSENWDWNIVLLLYVAQSLIIGIFHFFKILRLENFSTENFSREFGLKINGKSLNLNGLTKNQIKKQAGYNFLIGYLIFHLTYVFFIIFLSIFSEIRNDSNIMLTGLNIGINFPTSFFILIFVFFINHFVSFLLFRVEQKNEVNLGKFLNQVFIRIVPVHIAIILGVFLFIQFGEVSYLLFIFLILKTIIDILMHVMEHS